jgi:uncharacterized protein DUF6884
VPAGGAQVPITTYRDATVKTIVLISCVSKKRSQPSRAESLYVSPLFVGSLRYARSLQPDHIFILSAEHHLLDLDTVVAPYNTTLKTMSSVAVQQWAERVLEQLKARTDLQVDRFIFLAGDKYRKHLLPQISSYSIPLKGLGIGKQLQWLAAHGRGEHP